MVQMIRLKSHEEWLNHRERIGGSDAAAIVGMNPYKSNVELWGRVLDYIGVEWEDIPAVQMSLEDFLEVTP